jgi:hypothetical protein
MPTALKITTVSTTDRGLAVLILLLLASSAISLIAVHLVDRGVDPISMAVSDYGAREHAWFYRLMAAWLGLAGLLVAVIFADAIYPRPTLTILALLLFAATRWAITIFPTDIEGEEQTDTGRTHIALAVAAFSSIAVAAAAFASESRHDPFWEQHHSLIALLGWLLPVAAVIMGATYALMPRIFGLVERIYYLCIFAWLAAIAAIVLGA